MPLLNNFHAAAHQSPNKILLQRSSINFTNNQRKRIISRIGVNADKMSYLDVAAKSDSTFHIVYYLDISEDFLRFPE